MPVHFDSDQESDIIRDLQSSRDVQSRNGWKALLL